MTDLTRIDDGPVATVYSGHRAGVPVAVKVFPKRFDKRTMSSFSKEQAKLATVRRVTSILMVDGVEEMPSGESALRMELCTQSLAALVERVGQLAAADVAILGRAMASALAAAHSVGVVHGGVSPSNVLFRDNGEPVVGDFGVTLRQAFTRDPLHAIEYLPPETLRNGTLNELTDLYGLGAVLHFALTGRSPHPGRLGEQPGERVLRILGEPVPAINRQDVPVGLSTLVARLLATTPDRRPQEAAQVADHLTAMLPNPPAEPTTEDWDDFDAPTPPPLPTVHEDPLDFDDFATRPGWPPQPAPTRQPMPPLGSAPGPAFAYGYPPAPPVPVQNGLPSAVPTTEPAVREPTAPDLAAPEQAAVPESSAPEPAGSAPPAFESTAVGPVGSGPVVPTPAVSEPVMAEPVSPELAVLRSSVSDLAAPAQAVVLEPPASGPAVPESAAPDLAAPEQAVLPEPAPQPAVSAPAAPNRTATEPAIPGSAGSEPAASASPAFESTVVGRVGSEPGGVMPAVSGLVAPESAALGSVVFEPAVSEQVAVGPVGSGPVASTPVVSEPVMPEPVSPEPAGLRSSVPDLAAPEQAVVLEPPAFGPAESAAPDLAAPEQAVLPEPASQPAVSAPAAPNRTATEPAIPGTAGSEPAGSVPVVVEPAASEPAAPEPMAPEPAVVEAPVGAEAADQQAGLLVTPFSDPLLPLAPPPTPVAVKADGVLRQPPHEPSGVEVLVTAPVATAHRSGVVLGGVPRDQDFDDDFGSVRRATVLAGPLAPPDQPNRRLIRYDLLAGAALLLALLALVPLLLLRGDPDEIPSSAKLPAAGESDAAEVTVELAEPTDLSDKVQLSWKATRDLDFAVVVAAEGEKPQVLLVQRNNSMTVDVEPGRKYCFMIQATDGDQVYESEPQPVRGATCRK